MLLMKMTDNRSGYGNALLSLAEANNKQGEPPKIAGVSCDLEGSVKMGGFHKHSPDGYLELGIQEHHAAAMLGPSAVTTWSPSFPPLAPLLFLRCITRIA